VLLSGAGWFALNAITMSGLSPREAMQTEILKVVLTDTHFGKLWELRGALWIMTAFAAILLPARARRLALLCLTGALAGSLAWAGHGTEGNPAGWHLGADVVHLLIGGLWPAGLLPFLLLLTALRKSEGPEKWTAIAAVTRRFSAMSLASVILLSATGLINSLYLVGSPSHLLTTDYGKALTTKLVIFLMMIGLGAINLLRWKPRLSAAPDARAAHVAARLKRNVAIEFALGAIILVLVGLLGILPPAIDAMAHHHHH
jgi:putative copper export protein